MFHLVFRDFLGAAAAQALLAYMDASRDAFSPADVHAGDDTRVDAAIRQSSRLRECGPLGEDLEQRVRAQLPALVEGLGLPRFEVADLETEFVAHGHGAFFARHIDTVIGSPAGRRPRMISTVYYFHRQPRSFSGGELRLYEPVPGSTAAITVLPEHDTLVAFPAFVPHEVLPVTCAPDDFMASRFSFNAWFRRAATVKPV
jgi:SM-20-related protein